LPLGANIWLSPRQRSVYGQDAWMVC
jgi:hypothetical protein